MIKSKSEIIISIALVLVVVLLVGYNIFSMEMQKIEAQRRLEEEARLEEERERSEREVLEELKSEETKELAEYYQRYRLIKDEFIKKTAELSEKMKDEVISTGELKELTTERLDAARDYKEKLIGIGNVPKPLEAFLSYELEFIESDIKTVNLVLSYYDSESYSGFNSSAIDKLSEDTQSLLSRAEKELQRVCERYGLEYLFEESS